MATLTIQQAINLATRHHVAGEFADSEAICRQILQQQPGNVDALCLLADAYHRVGRYDEAAKLLHQAIGIQDEVPHLHNNLGEAYRMLGQTEQAVGCYRTALSFKGDYVEAQSNLGIALADLGRLEEAAEAFRAAIALEPRKSDAYNNLGVLLRQMGRRDEAVQAYTDAIHHRPGYARAYCNLSHVLWELDRFDEAIGAARAALASEPNNIMAHNQLGIALAGKGWLQQSVAEYQTALQLKPDDADVHNNLGHALMEQGRIGDAAAEFRAAVSLRPNFSAGLSNLGMALREQGHISESLHSFERAVSLSPQSADAHWNHSLLQLLVGKFEAGWPEYEWRWRCRDSGSAPRNFNRPLWQGEELTGKTILLHTEQGYGDTLQFIRYAPLAAGRGGRVIIECQPALCGMLENMAGVQGVVPAGQPLPAFDVHCPLMSLARVFKTRLDNLPSNVPYLSADPKRRQEWRSRLPSADGRLRVGLVWVGRQVPLLNRKRTVPTSELARLAPALNAGVTFVSLQRPEPGLPPQIPPPQLNCVDLSGQLDDFRDTAAVLAELDLILTIDTAIAHLAGAMGRPVWTMLPYVPDWRWLLDRDDSPWYPTMRLFRQTAPGDWVGVLQRVAQELAGWKERPWPR